ncbi:MAG: DNA repair protein RecO [Oscillospiraceae bacterium]|nr:DNA repair protein RecO [Oscillospiraceae bacterium]
MYKTLHGLVLREVKYKESSKILTILTEEEGKITAEAKGVLRKGSKCAASAQVPVWSELTFSEYKGRHTLTEGSVLEDFAALRADFSDLSLAYYFAELLETTAVEGTADPALLHLGLNALFALSRKLYPPEHIKAVFELRLMSLSGFAPALDRCSVCGEPNPEAPWFSLRGGTIRCGRCPRQEEGRSLPLCQASLAAMRHVCHASPKRIFSFTLDGPSSRRFSKACQEFAAVQLDREFRTLDFWQKLQPEE